MYIERMVPVIQKDFCRSDCCIEIS